MQKLRTLTKTDVDPMAKAMKSVSEVMVMPMPAVRKVAPILWATDMSRLPWVLLHPDISRNMSSTPIPAATAHI